MNRHRHNGGKTVFSAVSSMISNSWRPNNTSANSLLNAAKHYDISNDMCAAFLSKDMTYSCPIWRSTSLSWTTYEGTENLEDSQQTKLLRFVKGAKLKASGHVLEIGTGWGSFAIEAVKRTGCRVTTMGTFHAYSSKQHEAPHSYGSIVNHPQLCMRRVRIF